MHSAGRAVFHCMVWPVITRLLMAAALAFSPSQSAKVPTLRQALAENRMTATTGLPQSLLSTPIYGYAFDADNSEAVVAFFDQMVKLHAARLDRKSGRWQHSVIHVDDVAGPGNSIVGLKRTPRYIYLESHINPSASRLIILSHDLKLRRALYGWEIARLPQESVVYHHSEIHFAPTHSLEISVFNPSTLREKHIYPPEPRQPVRLRFVDRVAQEYRRRGDEWFRIHNHHMNPELFDSSLVGDVTVDDRSKTMSFLVQFGDPANLLDPLPFMERVRVTCSSIDQIEKIECREVAAQ
jgi:hypothetical protein